MNLHSGSSKCWIHFLLLHDWSKWWSTRVTKYSKMEDGKWFTWTMKLKKSAAPRCSLIPQLLSKINFNLKWKSHLAFTCARTRRRLMFAPSESRSHLCQASWLLSACRQSISKPSLGAWEIWFVPTQSSKFKSNLTMNRYKALPNMLATSSEPGELGRHSLATQNWLQEVIIAVINVFNRGGNWMNVLKTWCFIGISRLAIELPCAWMVLNHDDALYVSLDSGAQLVFTWSSENPSLHLWDREAGSGKRDEEEEAAEEEKRRANCWGTPLNSPCFYQLDLQINNWISASHRAGSEETGEHIDSLFSLILQTNIPLQTSLSHTWTALRQLHRNPVHGEQLLRLHLVEPLTSGEANEKGDSIDANGWGQEQTFNTANMKRIFWSFEYTD